MQGIVLQPFFSSSPSLQSLFFFLILLSFILSRLKSFSFDEIVCVLYKSINFPFTEVQQEKLYNPSSRIWTQWSFSLTLQHAYRHCHCSSLAQAAILLKYHGYSFHVISRQPISQQISWCFGSYHLSAVSFTILSGPQVQELCCRSIHWGHAPHRQFFYPF